MPRHPFPPVSLRNLAGAARGAALVNDSDGARVSGISQDSRDIEPGDLFCCVVGGSTDGHLFAREAAERGAAALVTERPVDGLPSTLPRIEVPSVRTEIGRIASRAFGDPAERLRLIGVTGTNGKTSTVEMIGSILRAAGSKVRVIGTLTGERTTPEAIDLHAMLRGAVDAGVDSAVMEVSSHALDQRRVDGIVFDAAVFTNLGRDHLDYHGTMEAYFAAKARLFEPGLSRRGVVNLDDPHGRLLLDASSVPMRGYSVSDATDVVIGVASISFTWKGHRIGLPVGGGFMLSNALAAATVADELGVAPAAIIEGCATLPPIKGRFQSLSSTDGVSVIVDYAHTPEALTELLTNVRAVAGGRVILVFGCGGNRDAGKRPLMGEVASRLADAVIVTSDNPRGEDPMAIIGDIVSGTRGGAVAPHSEPDRAVAIASAIGDASRGDIVVIAGKGHETTQEIAGAFVPFDDIEVARGALAARVGGRDGGGPGSPRAETEDIEEGGAQ